MVEEELGLTKEEAIRAYINKPKSEDFYIDAFNRYEVDGVERFQWIWSWWAFAGGVFFLLYRKLYIEAVVFFILSFVATQVPFAGIALMIASGGIFIYFVYKRYKKIVTTAVEHEIKGDMAVESLNELGGYNQWSLYVAVGLNLLFMIGFLYIISTLANNPGALREALEIFQQR